MVGAEQRQCALENRRGVGAAAVLAVESGELVEALSDLRMVGPEDRLAGREASLDGRFSLVIASLALIDQATFRRDS